jgi:hypothetical protein
VSYYYCAAALSLEFLSASSWAGAEKERRIEQAQQAQLYWDSRDTKRHNCVASRFRTEVVWPRQSLS